MYVCNGEGATQEAGSDGDGICRWCLPRYPPGGLPAGQEAFALLGFCTFHPFRLCRLTRVFERLAPALDGTQTETGLSLRLRAAAALGTARAFKLTKALNAAP